MTLAIFPYGPPTRWLPSPACSASGYSRRRSARCVFWSRARLLLTLVAASVALALPPAWSWAQTHQQFSALLKEADQLRRQGKFVLAAEKLSAAYDRADDPTSRGRAAAALGQVYARMNLNDRAEARLTEALEALSDPRARALVALDLANLYASSGGWEEADVRYDEAVRLAPDDLPLTLSVRLNRARQLGSAAHLAELSAIARQLPALMDPVERARFALNIGLSARTVSRDETLGADEHAGALALAFRALDAARAEASQLSDDRLAAEAYDGLADLYEKAERFTDAIRLSERGLLHARRVDAQEPIIQLEWRLGRLLKRRGDDERALAAYRRAVRAVEAIRSDIPIHYQDGSSSFRVTLGPIYLQLTDLLLQRSRNIDPAQREVLWREAREQLERIKQTELDDYLRDRCTVASARVTGRQSLLAGTAIYYPIVLPDRLEFLIEHRGGIEPAGAPVPVTAKQLQAEVRAFLGALRARGPYAQHALQLYRWLIEPIEPILAKRGIKTVVSVPDSFLRLVPLGALHDGHDFLVKRFAIAVAPGLSFGSPIESQRPGNGILLAGLSEPGPVVNKLPRSLTSVLLRQSRAGSCRAHAPLQDSETTAALPQPATDFSDRTQALRGALSLCGIEQEIRNIEQAGSHSTQLLDESFTLQGLTEQMLHNSYRIVHIASHGFLGSSSEQTFVLTYDELLTLDRLQAMLRAAESPRPIDLITLSACHSAEGDDRAPLGLSGIAIRFHAKSALGTLWPVEDNATTELMSRFYKNLAVRGMTKIGALRQAQLSLIAGSEFSHPFYWAPFILVGDWQ
ncbi:MAG TPA: CHAT domain-containing protein [Burkholderiales bacterium]|nr:CHAT domain-containing protein [Burkholderiales bacterium]